MKQNVLTIVLPIRKGAALQKIRELHDIGDEVLKDPEHPEIFSDVSCLHFLSCCVLDAKTTRTRKPCPPCVVVELSFDGDSHDFLHYFVNKKHATICRILANCEGYPDSPSIPDTIRYLQARACDNQAVYLGTPGRGQPQIDQEQGLRRELAEALANPQAEGVTREERWKEAVAAVRKSRTKDGKDFLPAPRRPLRVRLNPANPLFRARLRRAVRLLSWAAFWLAGVIAIVQFAREPWHAIPVIAAPAALAIVAAATVLRNSPQRILRPARRSVVGLALGEFARTALWLVPVGGLVVAAFELDWQQFWLDTALFWSIAIPLIGIATGLVAALAFLLVGRSAAVLCGAAVVGVLVWRLRVSPTSPAEIGIAAIASVALGVLLAGLYAVALRRIESRREVWDEEVDPKHLERVARREHTHYQSHLISETEIEPGRLRAGTLRAVLRTINFFARYWFNLGHLAEIPSIHFARFVVLPERESLLFLSNYDGRFEDYLGQFARVWGVTAVWGNTELEIDGGERRGFPRPFLLVLDGARREDRFKLYARASQVESLIWYSAYPNLSVSEIDQATTLHECMDQPIDDGRTGWLADLRRWWAPPLDEAALAALIDGL